MADPTLLTNLIFLQCFRLECQCPNCTYPIYIVAKVYEMHNRDGTLHTCGDAMADNEHLTYRDCPYYTRISVGDEAFSRCCISGRFCDADEAGLECDVWEKEKLEILKEEYTLLMDQGVQPDISSESF